MRTFTVASEYCKVTINKVDLGERREVIYYIETKNNDFHKMNCCS